MKKLINEVERVVPDMLGGLVALHQGLSLLDGHQVVLRADAGELATRGEVALVSGGGSGHEPAHGGYVGAGMLSAAVAGEVFTSPSTDAVLDAIRAVGSPAGVLLIVKNYTGDRLNFGLAAELARVEGIPTEMVIVADDVALSAHGDHAGRRGLAGTVLVHKLAGAAAAAGQSLAEVAAVARAAAADIGTMGVALSPCTVPAAGKPGFTLADGEIEWGLGIHGEAGIERGTLLAARDTVARLLAQISGELKLQAGDGVALLVNNLGGTPASELDIVAGNALAWLAEQGIRVERAWAGTFLSALDMAGISLSLMRVDASRLALLDAATKAPAWPRSDGRPGQTAKAGKPALPAKETKETKETKKTNNASSHLHPDAPLRRVIEAVCDCLIQAESVLTDMDSKVGDGDLGISLARAAQGIRADMDSWPGADDPAAVLRAMSATISRVVGGTSGPLYAILLMRAAASLAQATPAQRQAPKAWSDALSAAVEGVMELGGAKPGDRTMVDALHPAAQALSKQLAAGSDLAHALDATMHAATEGATATAQMMPRRGRSSYLGQRAVGHPDPGAHAVALWLASVKQALRH